MTNRNKAVLWIILVFLVGGIFGSATTYFLSRPQVEAGVDRTRPGEPKPGQRGRFMEFLTKELDLTQDQQIRVRTILESSRDRYRAISEEADQRSGEVLKETRQLLLQEFTSEQQDKFRDFIARHEKKRPHRR